MLTQVSALSLGPGIRVNAIVPGPVMKPAGRETSDEDWAKKGQRSALQPNWTAPKMSPALLSFLCREDYITGELLHVNAGEHLPLAHIRIPPNAAESSAVSRMAHANHYKSIRVDMRDFVLQITLLVTGRPSHKASCAQCRCTRL